MAKAGMFVGLLSLTACVKAQDNFPDVSDNHWAYELVEYYKKAGIIVGYPDRRGAHPIDRDEFARHTVQIVERLSEFCEWRSAALRPRSEPMDIIQLRDMEAKAGLALVAQIKLNLVQEYAKEVRAIPVDPLLLLAKLDSCPKPREIERECEARLAALGAGPVLPDSGQWAVHYRGLDTLSDFDVTFSGLDHYRNDRRASRFEFATLAIQAAKDIYSQLSQFQTFLEAELKYVEPTRDLGRQMLRRHFFAVQWRPPIQGWINAFGPEIRQQGTDPAMLSRELDRTEPVARKCRALCDQLIRKMSSDGQSDNR